MFSPQYLCICIYCMLQLGFLILMENRRRKVHAGQEKHFLWMLVISLFAFVWDILSSVDAGPGWFFPFEAAGNFLEILSNTLLLPIFFQYVCEQISDPDPKRKRGLNITLWIITAVCAALVISTAFTGRIFFFDSDGQYHRGPLFMIPMALLFAMMAIIEGFLFSQKKKIEATYFTTLALFMVPPLIGLILQSFVFGLPFSLLGITFAAQVVFANIQNRNMDKDYLTGAFNRRTLDSYVQRRIDGATAQRSFSAILLDIDNFKAINDRIGHYEGDAALVSAVRILRDSVGRTDFIARYGGDEFCIVLDTGDLAAVEETVQRIRDSLSDFNRDDKPYQMDFSMGWAVYHPSIGRQAASLYKVIDRRMYADKNTRKPRHG